MSSMAATSIPSFPNEILVKIIERCDLGTFLNFHLVDRSTNSLIELLKNQICKAVALNFMPNLEDKIAQHAQVMPQGAALLKRVSRYETSKGIAEFYIRHYDLLRNRDVGWGPGSTFDRNGDVEEALPPYLACMESGCAVSWGLSDIYKATKKELELDKSLRAVNLERRIYKDVTRAQLAYLASLSDAEVVCYRLFFVIRASPVHGWDWQDLGRMIANPRASTQGRDNASKELHTQAAQWGSWCSVNIDTPAATKKWNAEVEDELNAQPARTYFHYLDQKKAIKTAMARVAQVYSNTSTATRELQRDSARVILKAVDERVSKSKIRPSGLMLRAFNNLDLGSDLLYQWKEATSTGRYAQCLHY